MRKKRRLLSFLICSFLAMNILSAQQTSTLYPGYWTIGLNAGKAYQSSDVPTSAKGYGFGITLGKNLYYQPGANLSFDLRSRLLYARSYGFDARRNYNIEDNTSVNGEEGGSYITYPTELNEPNGFVYNNHRTDLGELGLEGVLTLNKLKERTDVKVSFFGGIGLDGYFVKTDQSKGGELYFEEYADLNERGPTDQRLKKLKNSIWDGEYETTADDFENGLKGKFMPSLGAEVGFQVSPKFSIDFGHRTTFSGTNLLDGEQWKDGTSDLFHYTYAGLSFNVNKKEKVVLPPFIKIMQPRYNPYTTENPNCKVYAKIENFDRYGEVEFLLNGREYPFSLNREKLIASCLLEEGENEIRITATTDAGTDVKQLIVYYTKKVIIDPPVIINNPPVGRRPYVRITNPRYRNTNSENGLIELVAEVENVRDDRDVDLFVDGRSHRFEFNARRGILKSKLRLRPGEHRITVVAFNPIGEMEDEVWVNVTRRQRLPFVEITQPVNGMETWSRRVKVVAEIFNVDDKRDVRFTVNNREKRDFEFRGDCIVAEVDLRDGRNVIRIEANNRAGNVADEVEVILKTRVHEIKPPSILILSPKDHFKTELNKVELRADVKHIKDAKQIELLVNGRTHRNFNFRNGMLKSTVALKEGRNTITVIATNRGGKAEASVLVRYIKKVVPKLPDVSITDPKNNLEVNLSDIDLRANTTNVTEKRQVDVFLNDIRITRFSFNEGLIKAKLKLKEGANAVLIQVTNKDGNAEDKVKVFYKKPVVYVPKPPVIEIMRPNNGSRSKKERAEFIANVEEINSKSQLTFFVNDEKHYGFEFKGGKVNTVVELRPGKNTLRMLAENIDGSDEASVVIYFDKPKKTNGSEEIQLPAPVIKMLNPKNANSEAYESKIKVLVDILNIKKKGQVSLWVNGRKTASNFDMNKGRLESTIRLKKGRNIIKVLAENTSGKTDETIYVKYVEKRKQEPEVGGTTLKPRIEKVNVDHPIIDPTNPSVARSMMTAVIKHVTNRNGISFFVNGKSNTTFVFDEKTGAFQGIANLVPGNNKLVLKAVNKSGKVEVEKIVAFGSGASGNKSIEAPIRGKKSVKSAPTKESSEKDEPEKTSTKSNKKQVKRKK